MLCPNVILFDGLTNNKLSSLVFESYSNLSTESQVKESLIEHANDGLDPHLVAASFGIGDVDL